MKTKNILIILLLLISISFSISSVSADPSDFGVNYSNATEKNTGNKNITYKESITIVDKVSVRGYNVPIKIEGVLYDKNTGQPFEIDGKNFTVTKYYNYTGNATYFSDGLVELEFILNLPKEYQNITLVVYNYLYADQGLGFALMDWHTNLNDPNQTVYIGFEPKIGTSAKENNTGNKVIVNKNKAVIIDTVKYKNLFIGREYTITGILMNKLTGEALLINGKQITAAKNFIANSTDGTIDLEFVFDIPKDMGNFSVVVFEKLFELGTKAEIAYHEDITDKNQTIDVVQDIKPPEEDDDEIPENPENENPKNPESENPKNHQIVNASMKSAGIPIIAMILVLLTSLSLITRKK